MAQSCGRKLFCYGGIFLVLIISGVLAWYFLVFVQNAPSEVPTCGGCHCLLQDDTTTACPTIGTAAAGSLDGSSSSSSSSNNNNISSLVGVDQDTLQIWQSTTPLNAYTLDCNPFEGYVDETDEGGSVNIDLNETENVVPTCQTVPALDTNLWQLGDTAVCAIHYERSTAVATGDVEDQDSIAFNRNSNITTSSSTTTDLAADACRSASYHLASYPSWEAAAAAGGHVTHVGACGVCSTLQDLAVYANLQFIGQTSPGTFCRQRSTPHTLENGLACYTGLGLTADCARIWSEASWYTAQKCFAECIIDPTLPGPFSTDGIAGVGDLFGFGSDDDSDSNSNKNNSSQFRIHPPAGCTINSCVQCEDEVTAPIFEKFAGRTRQRSGLLSTTIRPCSQLPTISHEPCPATIPLLDLDG